MDLRLLPDPSPEAGYGVVIVELIYGRTSYGALTLPGHILHIGFDVVFVAELVVLEATIPRICTDLLRKAFVEPLEILHSRYEAIGV